MELNQKITLPLCFRPKRRRQFSRCTPHHTLASTSWKSMQAEFQRQLARSTFPLWQHLCWRCVQRRTRCKCCSFFQTLTQVRLKGYGDKASQESSFQNRRGTQEMMSDERRLSRFFSGESCVRYRQELVAL